MKYFLIVFVLLVFILFSDTRNIQPVYCQELKQNSVENNLNSLITPSNSTGQNSALHISHDAIVKSNVRVNIDKQDVILDHMHGLVVEVHNSTDRALLIEGDKAVATLGSAHYQSAPLIKVENAACPPKSPLVKVATTTAAVVAAGATVGAIPTIRDSRMQSGPILKRYGCDEARRQDELSRFGKRIVWPGDTTKGVIYFATKHVLTGASVELPISSAFDHGDHTSVTILR